MNTLISNIIVNLIQFGPNIVLMITALLLFGIKNKFLYKLLALLSPILTLFLLMFSTQDYIASETTFTDFNISLHTVPPYAKLISVCFLVIFFLSIIYSFGFKQRRNELALLFLHVGSALGVVLGRNLLEILIHWELMTIGSIFVLIISHDQNKRMAIFRYISIHLLSGALFLSAIGHHYNIAGDFNFYNISLNINELYDIIKLKNYNSLPDFLIFFAILINLAAPPFSSWVPDTYANTSPVCGVFLSTFTTKTSVYLLITLFVGNELLIYIGIFMAIYGLVYALIHDHFKKLLCYLMINQIGLMLISIGYGQQENIDGAAMHIFSHVCYNTLLFMVAGAIKHTTGIEKLSELRNIYHFSKITTLCLVVAASSLMALPGTISFVSKSVIATGLNTNPMLWIIMQCLNAATVFNALIIILPWFVKYDSNSIMPFNITKLNLLAPAKLAMLTLAALCLLLGIMPDIIFSLLQEESDYQIFTTTHIIDQLFLVCSCFLALLVFSKYIVKHNKTILDFDWFYRVLLSNLITKFDKLIVYYRKKINLNKILFYEQLFCQTINNSTIFKGTSTITFILIVMTSLIILFNYI